MKFKILGEKTKGSGYHKRYEYVIQGNSAWGLKELKGAMTKAIETNQNYHLGINYTQLDITNKEKGKKASITLENTFSPEIKRAMVADHGVGQKMIEQFLKSVEKS